MPQVELLTGVGVAAGAGIIWWGLLVGCSSHSLPLWLLRQAQYRVPFLAGGLAAVEMGLLGPSDGFVGWQTAGMPRSC